MSKEDNTGLDLNILKMICMDTADPYLFALVITKAREIHFVLSTHESIDISKSVTTQSPMFDNTFVAVMM